MSVLTRGRSVVARWRQDGRLPESTSALLRAWVRLRVRTTKQRARAALLPAEGDQRNHGGQTLETDLQLGRRRWTAGPLTCSLHDLAHEQATEVVGCLQDANLRPYLTRADGPALSFGLNVEERADAWEALSRLGPDQGWRLWWRRGDRQGVHVLGRGRAPEAAKRGERWRIFRLHRIGAGALAGQDEAVELTFWAVGTTGRREQLGVRGLQRYAPESPATTEIVDGRPYPGIEAFPIGSALTRITEPIDVVYTWVDGNDPGWQTRFAAWNDRERPGDRGDHAVDPGRYRSRDELRYSLRSLWLSAGWVRRIYLVTDDQTPPWLEPDDRLRVVSHRDIFPADWLPVFNSHAIEARLHHIDGLAEQFLYFNDDMFLGRPVQPTDFFSSNGLSRFFASEAWIPAEGDPGPALAVDTAARNGRRIINDTFGRTVDRKLHHAPYALRRSVLAEIEERFPETVERTARSRFRHPDDLSIPSAFAHHYAYCTGRAYAGDIEVAYQNIENRRLRIFCERLLLGRDVDAFCLNETESTGVDTAAADDLVADFLASYFPIPSPWER